MSIIETQSLDDLLDALKQSNVDYNNSVNYQEQTSLALKQRDLIAQIHTAMTTQFML